MKFCYQPVLLSQYTFLFTFCRSLEILVQLAAFLTAQKIRRKLPIWSHILRKFLMENFIFCLLLPYNTIFVVLVSQVAKTQGLLLQWLNCLTETVTLPFFHCQIVFLKFLICFVLFTRIPEITATKSYSVLRVILLHLEPPRGNAID